MIYIGKGFLLLDFEPKSIHHSKPIIGKLIKEHQHHSNLRETKHQAAYLR
jgi:penicillin-binding protein-related factor A (putative recombinase)